jgi:hypothetical protein
MKTLFFLLALTTLAAAADVKSFKLATGELLVHAFEGGIPLPSDSKWSKCTGAGPSFVPEGGRYRINWNVFLDPKSSPAQLRDVVRVTAQEVSGKTAIPIFDGAPRTTDKGGLIVIAPAEIVSRENYPWLYKPDSTLFIFRVILFKAKEQDKLLQPVLIGAAVKQQLKKKGLLR